MSKLPWLQFYPSDWEGDTVAGCSLAAQGLWLRIMFVMHRSERYGYLVQNGSPIPMESIARRCGCTPLEYEPLFNELSLAGVPSTSADGIVFSRRMVKDERERQLGAERQRRLREKGGGDPERWTAIRIVILERDNYLCAYCGKEATTVDHVKPKSKGGTEDEWNLVACCRTCNYKKTNRTPQQAKMTFWDGFDLSRLENSDASVTPKKSEVRSQKSEVKQNLLLEADAAFSCEFFQVSKHQFAEYEQAYPGVPVEVELSKMAQWLKANGEKKNYPRFIANWLASAHNKLLEAQTNTVTREMVRHEQQRAGARVGAYNGGARCAIDGEEQ